MVGTEYIIPALQQSLGQAQSLYLYSDLVRKTTNLNSYAYLKKLPQPGSNVQFILRKKYWRLNQKLNTDYFLEITINGETINYCGASNQRQGCTLEDFEKFTRKNTYPLVDFWKNCNINELEQKAKMGWLGLLLIYNILIIAGYFYVRYEYETKKFMIQKENEIKKAREEILIEYLASNGNEENEDTVPNFNEDLIYQCYYDLDVPTDSFDSQPQDQEQFDSQPYYQESAQKFFKRDQDILHI